jgi:hypothetical protein
VVALVEEMPMADRRGNRGTALGFASVAPMKTIDIDQPATLPTPPAERKATDLCGNEYVGARCIRQRGHEGRHECLYWQGTIPLRWD